MAVLIGEILMGHPTLSIVDQVHGLYVPKAVSAGDTRGLAHTIAEEQHLLEVPGTTALLLDLDGRRPVRVARYRPPLAGDTGRVHLEKRDLTPKEEIDRRVQQVQQTTGLPYDKALSVVTKADPDLWDRSIEAPRQWQTTPVVQQQAAPTCEVILQMADARREGQAALTREQALAALALAHPHEPAFYDAHRRWHPSDAGHREHGHHVLAQRHPGQ